jgi:hypothetical protein
MSPRFVTNILLALAGGFVVVVSQALGVGATGWITFGVALGILGTIGLAELDRRRGLAQRMLDGAVGILGIWTVIASVVFGGGTLTWLSFAEGLGFVGLAVAGLAVHELSTERVVHSLAVEDGRAEDSRRTATQYSAS